MNRQFLAIATATAVLLVPLHFALSAAGSSEASASTGQKNARVIVWTKGTPQSHGISPLVNSARRRIATLSDVESDQGSQEPRKVRRNIYVATAAGISNEQLINLLKLDSNVVFAESDGEVTIPEPRVKAEEGNSKGDITTQDIAQPDWYKQSEVYGQVGGNVAADWMATHQAPIVGESEIKFSDSGVDTASSVYASHQPSDGWGRNFIDSQEPQNVMDNASPEDHGTKVISAAQLASVNAPLKYRVDKVIGNDLHGFVSDTVSSINDSIVRTTTTNHKVLVHNLSLAFLGPVATLSSAIHEAGDNGILVVIGAGNSTFVSGPLDLDAEVPKPEAPTSAMAMKAMFNGIAVASTDGTSKISDFSAFGKQTVEQSAPGNAVLAVGVGGFLTRVGGTSISTPAVSGAGAVVRLFRGTDPLNTRLHLNRTAKKLFPDQVVDGNFLDVGAALTTPVTITQPETIFFNGKGKYRGGRFTASVTSATPVSIQNIEGVFSPDNGIVIINVATFWGSGKALVFSKGGGEDIRKVKVPQ